MLGVLVYTENPCLEKPKHNNKKIKKTLLSLSYLGCMGESNNPRVYNPRIWEAETDTGASL